MSAIESINLHTGGENGIVQDQWRQIAKPFSAVLSFSQSLLQNNWLHRVIIFATIFLLLCQAVAATAAAQSLHPSGTIQTIANHTVTKQSDASPSFYKSFVKPILSPFAYVWRKTVSLYSSTAAWLGISGQGEDGRNSPSGSAKVSNSKDSIGKDRAKQNPSAKIPAAKLPFNNISGITLDNAGQIVIAIDAGHGGIDPGAIGIGKVQEKSITLAVARLLKQELERQNRYRVILTRNDDSYIDLRDRVDLARADGAQLFISLHANVSPNPKNAAAHGASIYTLSEEATDKETAILAHSENYVSQNFAHQISSATSNRGVAEITNTLIGMVQRETRRRSIQFARLVVDQFTDTVPLMEKPLRGDGFAVLTAADIPSVLIEMGFISNPKDVKRLTSQSEQKKIALAIAKSVDRWVKMQALMTASN